MKFSIVIPAYNEEKIIEACVEAAKKQRGGFELEIIVVDNASTDNTRMIAEKLGVKVIAELRKGVGRARRTGTEAARGELILQIDADTRLPEDYLEQVWERFQKSSRLVCLGGQVLFYDASWWQNWLRFWAHWALWLFVKIVTWGKVGPMGNNMTFRKEIYNQTGGFDSDLKFGEDMELCRQLSRFGKIQLDMSLKCYISARRFKLNKKFLVYALNFFRACFFGETEKAQLEHCEKL